MNLKNSSIGQLFSWLAPSPGEFTAYLSITILTLGLSVTELLRDFLYAPEDFNLVSFTLQSISDFIGSIAGQNLGSGVITAIFWGFIGLVVYLMVWLGINFSTELGNDLAITKYVHPRNVDTHSPLRDLISKTLFRLVTSIVLVIYLNILFGVLMPYVGGLYYSGGKAWPSIGSSKNFVVGVIIQLVAMHVLTVLVRFICLRKRVFGEGF
jgi:hypothetical protein